MKTTATILAALAIAGTGILMSGCETTPKRPLTAEEQAARAVRQAQAAAIGDAFAVAGMQMAAQQRANSTAFYNGLAQQAALNRMDMTNFVNGQIQSAQISTMNRELSGINNSLMYMNRSWSHW